MVSFTNNLTSSSFRFFFDFLVSSFHVIASVSGPYIGAKEANALLQWKASLDDQTQSFLSSWHGNGPCNWTGIICDKSRSVSSLNLSSSGLKGTLNGFSFSSFPKLRVLDLSYNYLKGTIPWDVGNLSRLTYLDLSNNGLIGDIPAAIGNLTNLVFLYLWENKLTGSIPQEIGMLGSLEILNLFNNSITGEIPVSFENFFNDLSKGNGHAEASVNLNGRGLWGTNDNRSVEMYEDNRSEAGSKRKMSFNEMNDPKKLERDASMSQASISMHTIAHNSSEAARYDGKTSERVKGEGKQHDTEEDVNGSSMNLRANTSTDRQIP